MIMKMSFALEASLHCNCVNIIITAFFPLLVRGSFKVLPSVLVPARYKPCAVFPAEEFPVTLPSVFHSL